MRKLFSTLAIALLVLGLALPALADCPPGCEIVNGDFSTDPFATGGGWYRSPTSPTGAGYRPTWISGSYVGMNDNYNGATGYIWQVVNEANFPGWIEDGIAKHIDLTFDYFIDGTNNYVQAFLYYQPAGNTDAFGTPTSTTWTLAFDSGQLMGDYNAWKSADYDIDITDFQPQYVALVFKFYTKGSSSGAESYIDNVCMVAQCTPVPVPGAVWLLGSGLVALVGLKRRQSA